MPYYYSGNSIDVKKKTTLFYLSLLTAVYSLLNEGKCEETALLSVEFPWAQLRPWSITSYCVFWLIFSEKDPSLNYFIHLLSPVIL